MIPIKPFSFTSIEFADFFIKFIDFLLEYLDSIGGAFFDFLALLHFLLIFLNFFNLVVDIGGSGKHLLVYKLINIFL